MPCVIYITCKQTYSFYIAKDDSRKRIKFVRRYLSSFDSVALLGPRQVGMTTWPGNYSAATMAHRVISTENPVTAACGRPHGVGFRPPGTSDRPR